MSSCFIADGYTATKHLDAVFGLHPAVVVTYRPALSKARTELAFVSNTTADKVQDAENKLIERQKVTIDGEAVTAANAARLVPALRDKILALVLGYAGSDEEAADKGNCSAG